MTLRDEGDDPNDHPDAPQWAKDARCWAPVHSYPGKVQDALRVAWGLPRVLLPGGRTAGDLERVQLTHGHKVAKTTAAVMVRMGLAGWHWDIRSEPFNPRLWRVVLDHVGESAAAHLCVEHAPRPTGGPYAAPELKARARAEYPAAEWFEECGPLDARGLIFTTGPRRWRYIAPDGCISVEFSTRGMALSGLCIYIEEGRA